MRDNVHSLFLEATRNVFQLMLDLSDISDRSAENFPSDEGLGISIGIEGDLTGEVIYRFPNDTSLSMVNIMSGMEVDSVDDFAVSAISEIANIISGNVLTMLAENDLKCDIQPPVPSKPDENGGYELQTIKCISTTVGDVCLEIRLNAA